MEGVKNELMARLAAAVAEDGVCHHVWAERPGRQHAVGKDESVDEDEHTPFGRLQDGPDGGHHLVAPKMAHDAQWIRPIAGVIVHRAAEDTELAAHALVR